MKWAVKLAVLLALFLIPAAVLVVQLPVAVSNSYVEVVPPDTAVVGFTLTNLGLRQVCITSVSAPPGTHAEMHVTEFNGTFAVMKTVDKVCVGPLSAVRFGSLTYHIMLTGDVNAVRNGAVIQLTLDDGRVVEVKTPLGPVPASRSRD
jgi:copper(I)-binding protein